MDALDRTLFEIMADLPISTSVKVADAIGTKVSALKTTTVRDLDAYQLIDLCKASGISADELLGLPA